MQDSSPGPTPLNTLRAQEHFPPTDVPPCHTSGLSQCRSWPAMLFLPSPPAQGDPFSAQQLSPGEPQRFHQLPCHPYVCQSLCISVFPALGTTLAPSRCSVSARFKHGCLNAECIQEMQARGASSRSCPTFWQKAPLSKEPRGLGREARPFTLCTPHL